MHVRLQYIITSGACYLFRYDHFLIECSSHNVTHSNMSSSASIGSHAILQFFCKSNQQTIYRPWWSKRWWNIGTIAVWMIPHEETSISRDRFVNVEVSRVMPFIDRQPVVTVLLLLSCSTNRWSKNDDNRDLRISVIHSWCPSLLSFQAVWHCCYACWRMNTTISQSSEYFSGTNDAESRAWSCFFGSHVMCAVA